MINTGSSSACTELVCLYLCVLFLFDATICCMSSQEVATQYVPKRSAEQCLYFIVKTPCISKASELKLSNLSKCNDGNELDRKELW